MSGYYNDPNYQALFNESNGTFSTFQLPTGAVQGYILECIDSAGDAGWVDPATLGVTDVKGTANQVLANGTTGTPQKGSVTLTTPQNIDTAANVQFGTAKLTTGATSGYIAKTDSTGLLGWTNYLTNGVPLNYASLPTNGDELVNKTYVDSILTGMTFKATCMCVSVSNLTATYSGSGVGATLTATSNTVLTIDGYTPTINQRVLVNGQTTSSQNGIYTLTQVGTSLQPWILTRATDFDQPVEIPNGCTTTVEYGTLYAGTVWISTTVVVTVGTDPISFIVLKPLNQITASAPITKTSSNLSLDYNTTNLQVSGTSLNTIQNIDSTASPTFVTETLSGLTASTLVYANGSKTLASVSLGNSVALTGATLDTIQDIRTSAAPQFTALKLTTGAGAGKYLQSDASGNTSWVTLGTGVTSVTGTANQVLANGTSGSAQTGAITLTTPQSIGTSSNVQFGSLAIGAGLGGGKFDIQGSQTSGTSAYGALIRPTTTMTGNGTTYCQFYLGGSTTINGTGVNSIDMMQVAPTCTATTTCNNLMGVHVYPASGSGTINNTYGLFVENPSVGTNKYTAYFEGNVGIANTTPAYPLDVNGQTRLKFLSLNVPATAPASNVTFECNTPQTVNAGNIYGTSITSALGSISGTSNGYMLYVKPTHSNNSATINSYGVYIDSAGTTSGVIGNSIGLRAVVPSIGTARIAASLDNLNIGSSLTTTSPNANGLICQGNATFQSATASTLSYFDSSKNLSSVSLGSSLSLSGASLNAIQDIRTSALPTFAGLNISTAVSSTGTPCIINQTNTYRVDATSRQIGLQLATTFNPPDTIDRVYQLGVYQNITGVAGKTITTAYGIQCEGNNTPTCTVQYSYGGYFGLPMTGSIASISLFSRNFVCGTYFNTPPTNGAIIEGNVGIGKNSASTALDVNGTATCTDLVVSGAVNTTNSDWTSTLNTYSEDTYTFSYAGAITSSAGVVKATRVGRNVTLIFSGITPTTVTSGSNSTITTSQVIASKYRPVSTFYLPYLVVYKFATGTPVTGTSAAALIQIKSDGSFELCAGTGIGSNFIVGDVMGFNNFSVSYSV